MITSISLNPSIDRTLTVEGFTFLRGLTEAVLPEFLASMVFAFLPHLAAKAALRVFHKPREERVE